MHEHVMKHPSAAAAANGSPAARRSTAGAAAHPARRAWSAPALEVLPPLTELTLQSPIGGNEGGFSWLDVSNPTRRLG